MLFSILLAFLLNQERERYDRRQVAREIFNGQFRLVFKILSAANDINIKAFYHHLSFHLVSTHTFLYPSKVDIKST
jgi:hypothetical protein